MELIAEPIDRYIQPLRQQVPLGGVRRTQVRNAVVVPRRAVLRAGIGPAGLKLRPDHLPGGVQHCGGGLQLQGHMTGGVPPPAVYQQVFAVKERPPPCGDLKLRALSVRDKAQEGQIPPSGVPAIGLHIARLRPVLLQQAADIYIVEQAVPLEHQSPSKVAGHQFHDAVAVQVGHLRGSIHPCQKIDCRAGFSLFKNVIVVDRAVFIGIEIAVVADPHPIVSEQAGKFLLLVLLLRKAQKVVAGVGAHQEVVGRHVDIPSTAPREGSAAVRGMTSSAEPVAVVRLLVMLLSVVSWGRRLRRKDLHRNRFIGHQVRQGDGQRRPFLRRAAVRVRRRRGSVGRRRRLRGVCLGRGGSVRPDGRLRRHAPGEGYRAHNRRCRQSGQEGGALHFAALRNAGNPLLQPPLVGGHGGRRQQRVPGASLHGNQPQQGPPVRDPLLLP